MIATESEYEVIQGPYTCNGDPRGCEGERFGGCVHCDEKRRAAAQEKADLFAGQLRRMATWIEQHPAAAEQLLNAKAGVGERPKIALHKLSVLKEAFPGRAAVKRPFESSDVYSLEHDGILFEAWERARPANPESEQVTL